jgi:hypothetical protein
MTPEEYSLLFHRAQVNLVAFKQVFHCDDELRKMVEMAVAAEREACAKVCDVLSVHPEYASDITKLAALSIRARGETK